MTSTLLQILIAKCHDGTAYQVGGGSPPTTRRALRRLALALKQGLDRLGQQYEGVCNVRKYDTGLSHLGLSKCVPADAARRIARV